MSYPIDVTIPFEDNDPLDDVQPMRENFENISQFLSVDHVAPGAINNGMHNVVTTPVIDGGVHPNTAATIPKFYALTPTSSDVANSPPTLQFSKGGEVGGVQPVPTPVTAVHSTLAAIDVLTGNNTTLVNFDGMDVTYGEAMAIGVRKSDGVLIRQISYMFAWKSPTLLVASILSQQNFTISASGTNLILTNNTGVTLEVYWTVTFRRINP